MRVLPLAKLALSSLFLLSAQLDCAHAAELEQNTALWAALTLRSINEGALNPGNRIARNPKRTETVELRPDWKLTGSNWKLTARPRGIFTLDTVTTSGGNSNDAALLLRWSEGFASWNPLENLSLDYGLQNFQWGPAESCSPSNRIFREPVQVRDTLYVIRGKHLLRLSWLPSSKWSEVFLLEPTSNGEPEAEPGENYAAKAALKSEWSWAGGSHFAGLVLGWRNRGGSWLGEYFNLEPLEGFFLYADASHARGSRVSYPVSNNNGLYTTFAKNRMDEKKIYTFLAAGARYAFENGNDWRVEWIFQESGYSKGELNRATAAVTSRDILQLAEISQKKELASQSGLEFPSIHYLFSSARFPNAFGIRDWNLYLRGLRSLQDSSLAAFASSELAMGKQGTFIGSLGASIGRDASELKGTLDLAATVAYRHAW